MRGTTHRNQERRGMQKGDDILLREFLNDQDVEKTTKRNYHNVLQAWFTWMVLNGISSDEVRKPHLIKYKNEMYSKDKSPLYINTCLSILRKFYRFMDDSGYYPDIAAGIRGFKRYTGFRKKPLTLEQVDQLLNSIKKNTKIGMRDYLVIKLMLTSGLRAVEISRLNVGDFIEGSTPGVRVLGKGRKEKTFVRIPRELAAELKVFLGKRMEEILRPVFLVWEKRLHEDRYSAKYIGIMVKARMKDAGLNDKLLTAHSLRHTTAVMMINQGASLFDVQTQLRHTDANMTRNYLRFIEDEKRKELEWVDKLEATISGSRKTSLKLEST